MQVTTTSASERRTKYSVAVYNALEILRHATNHEILTVLQQTYPDVSATTVHRVTTRLKDRGTIGCAPKTADGSERYDVTTTPHHHFTCTSCGSTCDVPDNETSRHLMDHLRELSDACAFAGTLVLSGVCKKCAKKEIR